MKEKFDGLKKLAVLSDTELKNNSRYIKYVLQTRNLISELPQEEVKEFYDTCLKDKWLFIKQNSEIRKYVGDLELELNVDFKDARIPQDRKIKCTGKDCGVMFVFSANEQERYKNKSWSEPKHCPRCRCHSLRDEIEKIILGKDGKIFEDEYEIGKKKQELERYVESKCFNKENERDIRIKCALAIAYWQVETDDGKIKETFNEVLREVQQAREKKGADNRILEDIEEKARDYLREWEK